MSGEQSVTISENTKVKLGVVIGAVTVLAALGATLSSLRADVDEIKNNRWTIAQECESVLRTAILNPGIKMPDPRNPGSVIVVEQSIVDGKTRKERTP